VSIDYSVLPLSKGKTRKQLKARKRRGEAALIAVVRASCVIRDGRCALDRGAASDFAPSDIVNDNLIISSCDGPAEWAHMHARRRSKTRGMAPELRHDTQHSLMLCRFHHQEYDAKRLHITALTRKGADGPLKFRRAK